MAPRLNDLLIIEGIDAFGEDPTMQYDGFDEILPPDMGDFGLMSVSALVPTRDELMQTASAGGGMAAAMIGGLAAETILRERLKVPQGLLPVVHIGLGVIAGKFVSQWNPALGVGVAAGLAGLGIIRFLQSYLGVSVNLSGLDDFALSDFGDDDDTALPAELSDGMLDAIGVEEMNGLGGVVATEMDGLAGFRLM